MDAIDQAMAERTDQNFHHERHSLFRGVARVDLERLQIELAPQSETIEEKNVQRLKRIFTLEGCNRMNPEHHAAVLVSRQQLGFLLLASQTTQAALLNVTNKMPPKLMVSAHEPLLVLHGRHRLLAAKECLRPGDDWWTVDLYLDGEVDPCYGSSYGN